MRRLLALLLVLWGAPSWAGSVTASPPRALSVTVYRAPWRNGGSLNLRNLGGFALITETRVVHLPAGESKLRFEGVVDGIIPESAIVSGLPNGVIEKNRDAAVLSPSALVRAAIGAQITLVSTNKRTGKVTRLPATIRSAGDEGVVFQTAEGVQALRCSGLPETFSFDHIPNGLSAVPTLSVLTRAAHEVTATVTLTYLADHFDWAANYTATLNPDGKTLNLGAWITLANGNGVSLPNAQTQIVAGRLNKEYEAQFANALPRVIAKCWPKETTSDIHPQAEIELVRPYLPQLLFDYEGAITECIGGGRGRPRLCLKRLRIPSPRVDAPMMAMSAPAPPPPPPEQLGDLKLYRVPQLTTVAANQTKQTRLLEQHGVPFERIYLADFQAIPWNNQSIFTPATQLLRTKNDRAHELGLPLPAGQIALFQPTGARTLYAGEVPLRDLAEDEEVELTFGTAPDVQVKQTQHVFQANAPELTKLTPNVLAAYHSGRALWRVDISNAKPSPISFELRLRMNGGQKVTSADQPMGKKDGRPIFRLTIPANSSTVVNYTVE